MLLTVFNIIYVLVAIAMTILILLQRGAGAQAGSGFGGGASGTVFGARGASNFLSRSTAILATTFFLLSLAMAWYLKNAGELKPTDDLGVMGVATAPKTPPASGDIPAVPTTGQAASASPEVPTAPASAAPVTAVAAPATQAESTPAQPASNKSTDPKKKPGTH
ncbi:MAG: preprotein translocase subunit SecG [Proteobacteria bacterium]|nr:preprotein translocase subunit SecG [Pseudomonadota bacterium]